jgi:hypothetical protein
MELKSIKIIVGADYFFSILIYGKSNIKTTLVIRIYGGTEKPIE